MEYTEIVKYLAAPDCIGCRQGACIRGEIARKAANLVAKEKQYARGCHAETFTVPYSAIADWVRNSEKVVMIDGCFLRCHGRILRNLIDEKRLIEFDALSHYKKYTDIFDVDDVPEEERKGNIFRLSPFLLVN